MKNELKTRLLKKPVCEIVSNRVSVKCGPDGGGWRMADRKMRMIKCGWKIADDKMRMEKCGWKKCG